MIRTTKTRLGCEALEVRENPAVTASLSAGVLTVTGSESADHASVQALSSTQVRVNNYSTTGVWSSAGTFTGVTRIVFTGKGGNDRFTNETNKRMDADGGAGNDTITGGFGVDVIHGGIGNDTLYGGQGNDSLYGDAGNDYLYDRIVVGDVAVWEGGTNFLFGGTGEDTLTGGSGRDFMYGQDGKDKLYGLSGNDYLNGGQDGFADELWGGFGADTFVKENYMILGITLNRDAPKDFDAGQGDTKYPA